MEIKATTGAKGKVNHKKLIQQIKDSTKITPKQNDKK
jgi:hypothetical protein